MNHSGNKKKVKDSIFLKRSQCCVSLDNRAIKIVIHYHNEALDLTFNKLILIRDNLTEINCDQSLGQLHFSPDNCGSPWGLAKASSAQVAPSPSSGKFKCKANTISTVFYKCRPIAIEPQLKHNCN